jgi:hypothetical protein
MKSTLWIAGLALILGACSSGGSDVAGGDAVVTGQAQADTAVATMQNIVSTSPEDAEPIMDIGAIDLPMPEDAEPVSAI